MDGDCDSKPNIIKLESELILSDDEESSAGPSQEVSCKATSASTPRPNPVVLGNIDLKPLNDFSSATKIKFEDDFVLDSVPLIKMEKTEDRVPSAEQFNHYAPASSTSIGMLLDTTMDDTSDENSFKLKHSSLRGKKAEEFRNFFFFKKNANDAKVHCKDPNCKTSLSNRTWNLWRHVAGQHHALLIKYEEASKPGGSSRKEAKKPANISICLSPEELLSMCVDMVTKDGRPLSIFQDVGLKALLTRISQGFKTKLAINDESIKLEIQTRAHQLQLELKKRLYRRFLSIKVDSATRAGTSYIGINAQFVDGKKIKVVLLRCIPLYKYHTGEYLKNVIIDTLNQYDISVEKVFSMTTDNGNSMLKMSRLLSTDALKDMTAFAEFDIDEEDDSCLDSDISYNQHLQSVVELNLKYAMDMLEDIGVAVVRCGAHTLQLAVSDSLASTTFVSSLKKVRSHVKTLKAPTTMALIDKLGYKRPVIEQKTRWSSTYNMMKRFLVLRPFISEHAPEVDKEISERDWESVENIVNCLKPCAVATIHLHREDLPYSELMPVYVSCIETTKSFGNKYSNILVSNLENRKENVLTPNLYAAVLLDPRWKLLLNESQAKAGRNRLLQAWQRMCELKQAVKETSMQSEPAQQKPANGQQNIHKTLGSVLDKLMAANRESVSYFQILRTEAPFNIENLSEKLDEFLTGPKMDLEEDIITYWYGEQFYKPELSELAKVFLAIPVTQASAERLFSHVRFIKSDHRIGLKNDLLEAILFLRFDSSPPEY